MYTCKQGIYVLQSVSVCRVSAQTKHTWRYSPDHYFKAVAILLQTTGMLIATNLKSTFCSCIIMRQEQCSEAMHLYKTSVKQQIEYSYWKAVCYGGLVFNRLQITVKLSTSPGQSYVQVCPENIELSLVYVTCCLLLLLLFYIVVGMWVCFSYCMWLPCALCIAIKCVQQWPLVKSYCCH